MKTLNDNFVCNVLLTSFTFWSKIVCIGNFLLYLPILCNFYISLTILYLWTLTGLKWILELKLIFWLHHNLEGKYDKYDNFPYNQSDFYWCKITFQLIKIDSCQVQ